MKRAKSIYSALGCFFKSIQFKGKSTYCMWSTVMYGSSTTFIYGSSIDISMTSLSFVSRIVGKFLVPSGLQSPTAVSIDFKTSNGHSIPSALGFDCEVRRSTAMKYQLFDCEFVSGLLKVSGFVWYSLVVFGCGWMCKVVSGCIW